MRIDSDDPAAAAALDALRRSVCAHGATFSPHVCTLTRAGELTITADAAVDPEARLMQIPDTCLPEIDAFTLTVRDGALQIDAERDDLPEPARAGLHRLLDVYNACGKLGAWRRDCPWFALGADPELMAAVADLRRGAPKVAKQRDLAVRGDAEALLVTSFLGTRTFNLRAPPTGNGASGSAAADTGQSGDRTVLMPFVDFLNHDSRARPYQVSVDGDGVRRLWTHADRPVPGSAECFVRYAPLDATDTYLHYGFVDASAPMLKSVPVELNLPDGAVISAGARGGPAFQGKLPAHMQDLRFFVPPILDSRSGDHLAVARLFLPGPQAPRALRRVLAFLIAVIRPNQDAAAQHAAVLAAEAQVLAENRNRFDDLGRLVEAARARPPADPPPGREAALAAVERLVAEGRKRLDAYARRMGLG